ncbi:MAG: 4Fe-4S ferredoxin [Deltaproteobacteria bacterium]|nr:4Fe-4S ferredoxin [Deltaproteobacteria bacterium]MBM4324815.1 4Fe-4S ferredoxin [Deltaproteobacteria bacterium]
MKFKLDKKDFEIFLKDLMETYDLFAPVQLTQGVSVFKKIDKPEEVNLTQLVPQKSAKEVFFPQSETMFRYEMTENQSPIVSEQKIGRERVLLGARPCDIEAISIIEKVFVGEDYTDVYFLEKRKKTTIITLACNHPLTTCFCSSTGGGPFRKDGSDLFMIDLGESYLVELLTEKGLTFSKNRFFKGVGSKEIGLVKELEEKAAKKADSSIPVEGIEKRLDLMVESPFWDRIHEKCIGCGTCTFLCPTCHCFDITDEAINQKGVRVRNWDSCLFPIYSLETSGHNPRPTGRERTRQRLMHKFNYYPKNFGRVACVGCGRCILYCPVQFDIREAILYASSRRTEGRKGKIK